MRRGNIDNKTEKDSIDIYDNLIINSNKSPQEELGREIKNENLNNKNRFKTLLLFFICALLVISTTGVLLYRYNKILSDKQSPSSPNVQVGNDVDIKSNSKDAKYLVEFSDKYTYNPITVKEIEYTEGKIKIDGESQNKVQISYIEISGLLDTKIQDKINKEIKDSAFILNKNLNSNQQYGAYTYVEGNFANILSIQIYSYVYENNVAVKEQETYLNFNLATGERIKFLDLFADNTPMNSIIYDLKYKELAWDTELDLDMSEKEWDKAANMDNRDTSEYEDIILQAINRYKNLNKDEIDFFVTPNRIVVHLGINDGGELGGYVIDLYKYAEYVTLFKKFLTDNVIYEEIPSTQALVFNDYLGSIPEYYKTENSFLCFFDTSHFTYEQEVEREEIEKYSSELVALKRNLQKAHEERIKKEVQERATKNTKNGYIARFLPYADICEYGNVYGKESFICVGMYGSLEEMTKEYFNSNLYRLLAKQNAAPKVSVDDALVGGLDYTDKNIKNILYDEDGKELFELTVYYNLDGEKVASSYEELEQYIDNKYKEQEPVQEGEIYEEEEI